MTSTEEITDNSGQPPHKSPKGSSTDTPNPSRPATKPEVINIPSSSSASGGEDSNFDMAEFMRASTNVLEVLKKFKFTEAKDGKRYAFAQELVQKLLTVAPDHADFANTFSNMVEKHANAWRNNEATSVLCESLCSKRQRIVRTGCHVLLGTCAMVGAGTHIRLGGSDICWHSFHKIVGNAALFL